MKIHHFDFLTMQSQISRAIVNRKMDYKKVRADYKKSGLSDVRFSWDLMHFAGVDVCKLKSTMGPATNLYDYLNDSHINTALKAIVKNLDRVRL